MVLRMTTHTPLMGTTPGPTRAALAAAITAALDTAGISRLDASKETGIPRETFYRKCRGGSAFDADELAAIGALLNVPVSDLIASAEARAA